MPRTPLLAEKAVPTRRKAVSIWEGFATDIELAPLDTIPSLPWDLVSLSGNLGASGRAIARLCTLTQGSMRVTKLHQGLVQRIERGTL